MKVKGEAGIKYPWYMQSKCNGAIAAGYVVVAIVVTVVATDVVGRLLGTSWAICAGFWIRAAMEGAKRNAPIVVNLAVGMYPTEDDSKQAHESDSVRIH